ncbi:MAG TPA: hypothetical protein VIV12_11310 [Streptosporangiaceae bacterium]|jgi:hypothetical protein
MAVTVRGHDQDHAVLLLAAAQELDLDPSVVQTTDSDFVVPDEVAAKAGFDENGNLKKAAAKKAAAKSDKE